VHNFAGPFTSLNKLSTYAGAKPFPEINRHILTFLQLILIFRVTYCAHVGDAKRAASPVTLNRSKETIVTAQISLIILELILFSSFVAPGQLQHMFAN
jgi:hypothetical protein